MLTIALNLKGIRTSIEDIVQEEQYFCPICGSLLIPKKGTIREHHFAHKPGTQCSDNWHYEPMSDWHKNWQNCFPFECREVVTQNGNEKHRADICVGNYIIEFQHSPISPEDFSKRNKFYTNCGYNLIWVFDENNNIEHIANGSIDPLKCQENELRLIVPQQQFRETIPQNVYVFFEYNTSVSAKNYPLEKAPILIQITSLTPKNFSFLRTFPCYIARINFLKTFTNSEDAKILSILDIYNIAHTYQNSKPTVQHKKVVRIPISYRKYRPYNKRKPRL